MTEKTELETLLSHLQEECAEVVQSVSKADRFGLETVYNDVSNKEHLQQEMGDVVALIMIITLRHQNVCTVEQLHDAVERKITKLKKYVPSLADFNIDDEEITGI